VEDAYDCEKKSSNEEREGLHSASNPLLRGQVKRQGEQPRLEYGRSTGYKRMEGTFVCLRPLT
jgi:hypothetical protein